MEPVEERSEDAAYKIRTDPRVSPEINAPRWSLATRMAFRLVFAYEIIYSFPFPLTMVPAIGEAWGRHDALLAKMTVWTGAHILHLSRPLVYSSLAGGDSLFGWVRNLTQILIAVAAAGLWTVPSAAIAFTWTRPIGVWL